MSNDVYVLNVPPSYSMTMCERAKADAQRQIGDGVTVVVLPEGVSLKRLIGDDIGG